MFGAYQQVLVTALVGLTGYYMTFNVFTSVNVVKEYQAFKTQQAQDSKVRSTHGVD